MAYLIRLEMDSRENKRYCECFSEHDRDVALCAFNFTTFTTFESFPIRKVQKSHLDEMSKKKKDNKTCSTTQDHDSNALAVKTNQKLLH